MNDVSRRAHWENVYATKQDDQVSWFQENPAPSLALIDLAQPTPETTIVDIGGGASRLVDCLVARGFNYVTVLDLSEAALATAKARLGDQPNVQWVAADVTTWKPTQTYDIWHDRAAFHFLTDGSDRAAYAACLKQAIKPGGHVVIGSFAIDGPERCSGLPVNRYDAAGLAAELGKGFRLIDARRHEHATPWGAIQRFQFCIFQRSA
jgi:SAM-dependent methyltransferase